MNSEFKPSNKSGVLWGKYPEEYSKYEQEFPDAFPWPAKRDPEEPRYVKGSDGYWYDPQAIENGKAVLSCTGGIMCEPRQCRAYHYGGKYYFHPQFKYVRGVLKASDLSVGSLETTLTDITPYADQLYTQEEGGIHCNGPAEYLEALRYAGYDALVNANDHNCDSAVMGLIDTLDNMDKYGFMHTGTFHPTGDERILYVRVNGIRVAILSYATNFNKLESNFTKLGRDTLLNIYSKDKAQTDIAAAKANGAEFVLVYMHWGKEYTRDITELQQTRAQVLADAGADYIVGSHSHALQPYRRVISKDGRQVPVVYSMGNFVSNESRSLSKYTGILQIVLQKLDGRVEIKQDYFVPCYIFNKLALSKFVVVPTDVALSRGQWYQTQPENEAEIMGVMNELPKLTTTTITVKELCDVLEVPVPSGIKNRPATFICNNPSYVSDGCVFFGITRNGVSELKDVAKKGAIAIITNRQVEDLPCIVVDNVSDAFCKVFSHIRGRFAAKTIAVTGNAGKTTTKEILEFIIRDSYITLSSPGNWNTRNTSMMTLQRLRSYHEVYIQEVHEGDPNSAAMISRAIKPDYAVITNVGVAHRENFASDEEFRKAFTEIVEGMSSEGTLYVNGDDPLLMESVRKYVGERCRVKTFGICAEDLDYRIDDLTSDGNHIYFDVVYEGRNTHIEFPSPVKISAYSAVAAFAVGIGLGMDAEQIARSITGYKSDGIRQNVKEHDGLKLFLDCRSATPVSMRSSIESFCTVKLEENAKRIAVIGEMHIGENSKEEHKKIGQLIARTNIDYLYCYGKDAEYVLKTAVAEGFPEANAKYCKEKRELEIGLCGMLKPGDALLIKGGRRMYLNSTIRKLFALYYPID